MIFVEELKQNHTNGQFYLLPTKKDEIKKLSTI
jgi:hypothetical protein